MDTRFKNELYVPENGTRAMRVIKGEEYYDITITGGSGHKHREWLADHVVYLSMKYDSNWWCGVFDWEYVILGVYRDGFIVPNSGDIIAYGRSYERDGVELLNLYEVNPETLELGEVVQTSTV